MPETRLSDDTTAVLCGSGPQLTVASHGFTDPGRSRSNNEDQFLIATLNQALAVRESSTEDPGIRCGAPTGHLFVVADGMGGHAAGERASALAVTAIESFVVDSLNWCAQLQGDDEALLTEFKKALQHADRKLADDVRKHPDRRGMGTTITLAYLLGSDLYVAHVGDSRCYLLREHMLYRVTRDHTLVQEMVRRGIIPESQAAAHALRHVIANVLGGNDAGILVELHKLNLQPRDRLLLCSDGLTEMVAEEEIASVLGSALTPQESCQRLVDRANELGGKDNITVVVVHC